MKNIAFLVFNYCLLVTAPVYAALSLDQGYAINKPYVSMSPEEADDIRNFMESWENAVVRDIGANAELSGKIKSGGENRARMFLNKKKYYIWAQQYQVNKLLSSKEKNASEKGMNIHNNGVCDLYVHDDEMIKVASFRVNLPEYHYCNGIYGLGAVKGQDALLMTIAYVLENIKAVQKVDVDASNVKKMTILLKFHERNGKVFITQDDSCLGNPNKTGDILSARKALQQCAK
ncbi:hypothetical protein [Iodobacter fluviatilis]|uniref:Uncharacterized protein n=1 Tax=Iodobacter fluviatilis TaxID=537 RepID=A0A377Q510_9NEIS|nr:hypothetical protein [Iodobacter fluviatilis]TCU81528.1 hypothetical protein EV682_12143 [Iodobacter fluviatilis]STQ89902.1 Uncharacterised protein [Iodobacter fluviatilis]